MADYSLMAVALNDTNFREKVSAACLVNAFAVINEPVNTPNHTNRLTWANKLRTDENFRRDTAKRIIQVASCQDTNLQTLGVGISGAQIDTMIAVILGDVTLLSLVM